jgi:hypothetical protein
MYVDARVFGQPVADPNTFVGRVGAGHVLEEAQELLMAMPVLTETGDLASGDLQRGEQRRGAMTHVVMGAPLSPARLHWQHRLGAIQRLDLRLLIHAQHDRVLRRIQIQPDDVGV